MGNNAAQPDSPFPPRFRSLKRWSLVGVTVLLLLTGLRIWWGREAQQRLDAVVNEAHASGRKILVSDFTMPSVPDESNAAHALMNAATAIKESKEQSEWEFRHELPLTTTDVLMIRGLLEANETVLKKARAARELREVDWGVRVRTPVMNVLLPHLSHIRHLSNLTQEVAFYQHTQGNDREAVEAARDIFFHARSVDAEPSWVITHLVAAGMTSQSAQLVIEIAPNLRVESGAEPQQDPGGRGPPATREQVRALIVELSDDTDLRRGMSLGWQGEQMGLMDNIPFFAKQQLGKPLWTIFRPMFELDAVRGARAIEAYSKALAQPNYVQCMKAAPPPPNFDDPMILLSTRAMSRYLAVTPSNTLLRRHWTIVAERRMAAISLALRLYALDHDGRLPETLDELAPRYMAAVPNDPFTESSPFIYRGAGKNPILYSVGSNGRDDKGEWKTKVNPQLDVGISLKARPHITTAPATDPSE